MPAICPLTDGGGKQDVGLPVQQDEWRAVMAGGERDEETDHAIASGVSRAAAAAKECRTAIRHPWRSFDAETGIGAIMPQVIFHEAAVPADF
jgi:hypothetical protein